MDKSCLADSNISFWLKVELIKRESYKGNMVKMYLSWHVVWVSWTSDFAVLGKSF